MPILILLLAFFTMLAPVQALCYDVLVLQSLRDKGYHEAVQGFKRECAASMRTVVLSDFLAADVIRIVREEHPKLIVAVGERALDVAGKVRALPILYMLALSPRHHPSNASGVTMMLDPARYVAIFDSAGTRRIGVLYDPARNGAYVRRAQAVARKSGMELVAKEVRTPRETPALLDSLRGRVDVLWMLPDLTAVTSENTEAYFLFSQGEMVPVVTFSDFYLTMGGAVALNIDRYDIGRQVGEMARNVLSGTSIQEVPLQYPRKSTFRSNTKVLQRLKMSVSGGGP